MTLRTPRLCLFVLLFLVGAALAPAVHAYTATGNLPLQIEAPGSSWATVVADATSQSQTPGSPGSTSTIYSSFDVVNLVFEGDFTADANTTSLALLSDDGCDVTIDGTKVLAHFGATQHLPVLSESLSLLPITLNPGQTYHIRIDYSNVNGQPIGYVDGCTLFAYGAAGPAPFSVTLNPGQVSPNPIAVGQQMTATLSATPNNPPQTTAQATVTGPTWSWGVAQVDSSQDGITFTTTPAGSYSCNLNWPDQTKPKATFTATLNQAGYYRTKVTVTAIYHSVPTDGSPASDIIRSDTKYVLGIGPKTSSNPPANNGSSPSASVAFASVAPATPNAQGGGSVFGAGDLMVAASLKIFHNGQDITNTTIPATIGEGISLSTQIQPSGFDSLLFPNFSDDGSEYTWGVSGGYAVGGFAGDAVSGGPLPLGNSLAVFPQTQMSGNLFKLYWAGSNPIPAIFNPQVNLSLTGTAVSVSTNFSVSGPTGIFSSISAVMKQETVDFNWNRGSADQYKLHLGRPSSPAATDGIVWTFKVNSSVGHYEMIQTINNEVGSITLKSGAVVNEYWIPESAGTFPALDTQYPVLGTVDPPYNKVVGDSPGIVLDNSYSSVTYTDDFRDYLMFHPNTPDWCWVPIGTMGWAAGGVGTNPKMLMEASQTHGKAVNLFL